MTPLQPHGVQENFSGIAERCLRDRMRVGDVGDVGAMGCVGDEIDETMSRVSVLQ